MHKGLAFLGMVLMPIMAACGGGATPIVGTANPPVIVVSVSPVTTGVATLQLKTFQATVSNDRGGQGVSWQLFGAGCSGPACGTLANATSTSVEYTAPSTVPITPFVTVTATSVVDHSKSDSAKITLFYPGQITVTVNPLSQLMATHESGTFTATVLNDPADAGVTWTIEPACNLTGISLCGTVAPAATASGLPTTYSAPPALIGISSITLRASSQTDPAASATATVALTCSVPSECIP